MWCFGGWGNFEYGEAEVRCRWGNVWAFCLLCITGFHGDLECNIFLSIVCARLRSRMNFHEVDEASLGGTTLDTFISSVDVCIRYTARTGFSIRRWLKRGTPLCITQNDKNGIVDTILRPILSYLPTRNRHKQPSSSDIIHDTFQSHFMPYMYVCMYVWYWDFYESNHNYQIVNFDMKMKKAYETLLREPEL